MARCWKAEFVDASTLRIPLTKGKFALIDASDLPLVADYSWLLAGTDQHSYARTSQGGTPISMHRAIMSPPAGMVVDHKNHDGLDNRRCNLRVCTQGENMHNRRVTTRAMHSRFKGVTKSGRQWMARIRVNYTNLFIGTFPDEVTAARAYDAAAKKHHGDFAKTNEAMGLFAA